MEVKLNTNVNGVSLRPDNSNKTRTAAVKGDSTSFAGSDDLNLSLKETPSVRVENVKRAQELIGDVNYPPRETIRRIAALLAMHIDQSSDES